MQAKQYNQLVKEKVPKSKHLKTMINAFWVGGVICMIGEGFKDLYTYAIPQYDEKLINMLVTITMIFIGSFLTGIGVYDRIGRYAGAGSIIPITGFANSIVSPSMEFNREGIVFGVMCKMFVIAGPIIVAGIVGSIVIGAIYWIAGLI